MLDLISSVIAVLPSLGDVFLAAVRLSMPISYAALGGLLCERAGVFNIALEGEMLVGAFCAALGAYFGGNAWFGLGAAVLSGGLLGLLLAILGITLRGNQIVIGLAITMFAGGFTSFLARIIFPKGGSSLTLPGFHATAPGDMSGVLGFLLSQDVLFYLMVLTILVLTAVLYRSPWGLAARACGENPAAVDAAGVSVVKLRYVCVILGSALAAIGGAYIVLVQVFLFSDSMTAGRGFIALSAVVLGRWTPLGAVAACLFFGFCDAAQLQLQSSAPSIPNQLFAAVPYVASVFALLGLVGPVRPPKSIGKPYDREER